MKAYQIERIREPLTYLIFIYFHKFNFLNLMYSRTRQNNKKVQDFYREPAQSIQSTNIKLPPTYVQEKLNFRKKDKVIIKRKLKEQPSKQSAQKTQAQNSSSQNNHQLKSQQSLNNSSCNDREGEPSHQLYEDPPKDDYQLQKLIKKANYIKVQQNCILKGYTGHSSIIFKRPILEGSYYFQVKILKPIQNQFNLKFQPSVRIGICSFDYPHTIPLGGKGSICYRSIDGMQIENKNASKFGPSYTTGDIIGLQMKVAPPHKYPNKQEKNQASKITFYKNSQKIGEYDNLKQIFYTVGISLFNFAAVELRILDSNIKNMPEGFQAYIQSLNKEIPYKDLKNSRIFNE